MLSRMFFNSVRAQNLYDNHLGLDNVINEVHLWFAKEEAQSFHIAFPRLVWTPSRGSGLGCSKTEGSVVC
jgi:hypothetical protein